MELTLGNESSQGVPARGASFAEKLRYYESQHQSTGVRMTHLVGIPGAAASLPLLVARPRWGIRLFLISWGLQVLGHWRYEGNSPALTKGVISFQLCGLAFWCQELHDVIQGKGLGGVSGVVTTTAPKEHKA